MSQEYMKYINVDEALVRMRGNKKLYVKMLDLFLSVNEFTQFEEAIKQGDLNKAADVAHAIKGMTGNLSLTALFEQSEILMRQLRQGELDQNLIADYRDSYTITLGFVEKVKNELEAGS